MTTTSSSLSTGFRSPKLFLLSSAQSHQPTASFTRGLRPFQHFLEFISFSSSKDGTNFLSHCSSSSSITRIRTTALSLSFFAVYFGNGGRRRNSFRYLRSPSGMVPMLNPEYNELGAGIYVIQCLPSTIPMLGFSHNIPMRQSSGGISNEQGQKVRQQRGHQRQLV